MKPNNTQNGPQAPKKKDTREIIKITKEMNLGEIVFKYPETAEVILDFGLHCVGCFASSFDTIEQGAQIHGLSPEELDEMIERINEVIEFRE